MKHENPVLNKYQATYNISFIVPHLTLDKTPQKHRPFSDGNPR